LGGYNYSFNVEFPPLQPGGFIRLEYRVGTTGCYDSSFHVIEVIPLCSRRNGADLPEISVDIDYFSGSNTPTTVDLEQLVITDSISQPAGDIVYGNALCNPNQLVPGTWTQVSSSPTSPSNILSGSVVDLSQIMTDPSGPSVGQQGTYTFRFDPTSTFTYDDSDPSACERCHIEVTLNVTNIEPIGNIATIQTPEQCVGANDASIEVFQVAGGVGPYEYSLDGGP
jgi:hypothetical protein